jgi:hypothetical protein
LASVIMTSQSLFRLTSLLTVAGLSTVASHARASSCDEPASRWLPQRSWPSACELNVPVDGFVLLEGDAIPDGAPGGEGELQVFVQRMSAGAPLEVVGGSITQADATSALFRSERALQPHADYVIVAKRVAGEGVSSATFTSSFTTGSQALAPVAFRAGSAELTLEQHNKVVKQCEDDGCGVARCTPTGETVDARLVRIAVPAIEGGISQRPYSVSAQVALNGAEQAALVATSDTVATQAGKRSFLTVELPALASAAQGCVTIQARDVAGHEAKLEAGCLELAADAQPTEPEAAADESTELTTSESAATAEFVRGGEDTLDAQDDVLGEDHDAVAAEGSGCAVAGSPRAAGSLAWVAVALTLTRLRSRRRRI